MEINFFKLSLICSHPTPTQVQVCHCDKQVQEMADEVLFKIKCKIDTTVRLAY